MRELNDHIINPANDALKIQVLDEPGSGGAHRRYVIVQPNGAHWPIDFQDGLINEVGVNGLTHEALLAIVMDRLRSFQKGPYACRENALALTKIEESMHWLQQRTLARMRRGVEGTHQV